MQAVYHFSEEPDIKVFEPRTPAHRPDVEPLVWAIAEEFQPAYFFPRDCPRILLWCTDTTSAADRSHWFGESDARMLAYVEYGWLERMREASLYRYELPPDELRATGGRPMDVGQPPSGCTARRGAD